jgi:hypothetical protein
MTHDAYSTKQPIMLSIALALFCFTAFYAFSAHAFIFGTVSSSFSCGGGGGQLLNSGGNCPTSLDDGKIFSYFVCEMERLIGEVFGQLYCQTQSQLMGPMAAVVTLAITLFGVAFLIGVVQSTAREFVIFLLKVAAVWGFATQAELMVGVAYNFFMGGLKEGIAIVVGAIFQPAGGMGGGGMGGGGQQGGQEIYAYMDQIFEKLVKSTTESAGADPNGGGGGGGGAAEFCKNAIFAGLALLVIAFPPLAAMGMMLVVRFVIFLLRAVFGYIFAVMGISFLIVIGPIFLAFFFWKQTRQYFDKWVGHLAAFALQMVIIFAFIAFILSMDASRVGKELLDLIVPYNKNVEQSGIRWPWQVCTICEFEVVEGQGGGGAGGGGGGGKEVPGGSVRCKENPGKPLNPGSLAGFASSDDGQVTPEMRNTLLKVAAKTILTLLVLIYIINAMLDLIPQIAQRLASGGVVIAPDLMDVKAHPGHEKLQEMEEAFSKRMMQGGDPVSTWSDSFKDLVASARR